MSTTKLYRKTILVDLSVEAFDKADAARSIMALMRELRDGLPVGAAFDPVNTLDRRGKITGIYRI